MSKKYVPSGYQIISLDLSDKTPETPFTPSTEDEKILYDILNSHELKKPILIRIETSNARLTGFGVVSYSAIELSNNSYFEEIQVTDTNKLTWYETEK